MPAAVPVPAPTTAAPGTTSDASAQFRLSSFNVLGSSHTRNGARGRAPGVVRIHGAAQLLARHDVDVVGFQELQSDQARELLRATGGAYSLYPGAGPGKDSDNSIGWRSSQWQLVQATTESIPYFNGHHRRMPVVLLRHRASGIEAWFGNFHNPAETSQYHHQQRWRTEATRLEAALANRLQATGVPLFITGDMNERAPYFCRLTGAAPSMRAARGGSNGAGGCRVGQAARRRLDPRLPGRRVQRVRRGPHRPGGPHHRPPGDQHRRPDRRLGLPARRHRRPLSRHRARSPREDPARALGRGTFPQ